MRRLLSSGTIVGLIKPAGLVLCLGLGLGLAQLMVSPSEHANLALASPALAESHEEELSRLLAKALARIDYACYPIEEVRETFGYEEHLISNIDLFHVNPLLSGEGEGSRKTQEQGVTVGRPELLCTPVLKVPQM